MAALLLQPNIMKHAQKELDNLVGTNRLVEESDLQDLPYIQAILKETFRLHPPAPFLVPHHSIEACQVEGYIIPANTRVIVNVWAIGRDPNTWENPLKFDPDRFMKHPEIDVQGQDFSLLPFGSGRRGCPGRSFGMLVVQIMLARLLQSFDWSLPNNQHDLDMSERFGLDLKKAEALCAMAHPRLPSHFYH
jgi:cytochrome P450